MTATIPALSTRTAEMGNWLFMAPALLLVGKGFQPRHLSFCQTVRLDTEPFQPKHPLPVVVLDD